MQPQWSPGQPGLLHKTWEGGAVLPSAHILSGRSGDSVGKVCTVLLGEGISGTGTVAGLAGGGV